MGGKRLEAGKFALYLAIPAGLALYYAQPENLNSLVNRYKFVVYPAEDPRPPKDVDEIRALVKEQKEKKH